MAGARAPWWIITSAAIALHGLDPGPVGDVDVLMSPGDALGFCAARGLPCTSGSASDQFRSAIFARWLEPPLPVEIMAGFEVATDAGWRPVSPVSRRAVTTAGGTVYIPERGELAVILRTFGRPKDIARAALLDTWAI